MRTSWVGLAAVVLFVLLVRLVFAFHTPYFTGDEAYLHERSVHAALSGNLLWQDSLGYSGRTLIQSPVFDLILALFSFIMPVGMALKVIPNIFASLLVIPVYLLSWRLSKNIWIAGASALIASFVPAFIANTFNQITPLTIVLPLFFFLAYAWLQINKQIWTYTFVGLLLFFVFIHPLSILFVFCIGVYILLLNIERMKLRKAEYELGLFAIFFALWAQFLLYKKLILFHGPAVIWQNIPNGLLSTFYSDMTFLGAFWQIGVIPLVGGTHALYRTLLKPDRASLLLFSIAIVSSVMLWLKLIALTTGLMLLGITLTILLSKVLQFSLVYLKETKLARYASPLVFLYVLLALVMTAYPAYTSMNMELSSTISPEEVSALEFLHDTLPADSIIIAPVSYGHYISAIAQRKNVLDNYFLMQPRINERFEDIERLYKTSLETEAVSLFNKYDATHLVVPPGVADIKFSESHCFKRILAQNIRAYEKDPECEVRVVG